MHGSLAAHSDNTELVSNLRSAATGPHKITDSLNSVIAIIGRRNRYDRSHLSFTPIP